MTITGSCMCGGITYAIEADSYLAALCHCTDCQKVIDPALLPISQRRRKNQKINQNQWTGGAFTSNAVVPRTSFKVTKGKPIEKPESPIHLMQTGTPTTYDVTGASGKINKHFFCSTCGSGLYTELEVMPDNTVVKAGGLDGGEANLRGKIDVEFYVKDRPSYLAAVEGAKQEPMFG
ncbi:unnamed protein product [Penicillium salamii]|uniref:CENP-V/GFA domain-containing protein n=1 Tax=Penicillium salamii TaxID=1612424 RepID=A0A9W4NEG6_9EURO|nr:unnamed protein product [Penicillium salamii]CAG8002259.1 unnamed protein product [Penicillium salamii]CAG8045552.1 unnamed protein product [Penicillium salamii]CAG8066435.1 unnamed protein product [Penicillium salamii]CAG8224196.1 unnamed protein product [Penicillium salamii]